MRFRPFILGLGLGSLLLSSCNDDLTSIGSSIQPEGDKVVVYEDTFKIEASTVLMEAIYAKSDTTLLGEYYDPVYGTLKSDYICQFRCPPGFVFKHTPIDGKIDSIDLRIFHYSHIGDIYLPMRAEAFPVIKSLEKNYYTNIDPTEYCDMQNSLGQQTYTIYDRNISDSARYDDLDPYYDRITIRLPQELGQTFYDKTLHDPSVFASQEAFNEFFPGLYITNTFGTGGMVGVYDTELTIHYNYAEKDTLGQDSLVYATEIFNVTKEVIQLIRFKNGEEDNLLEPSDKHTYIKSPAGVTTKIVIPTSKMNQVIENRIINLFPFSLTAMAQEEWEYSISKSSRPKLLLIPEDSVKTFFENNKVDDNITTYVSQYNSLTSKYDFGNISQLIKYQKEHAPDKDLSMLIIPITSKTESNYYGSYTTSIFNYFIPWGGKFRKDGDLMKFVMTSSEYNDPN